MLLKINSHTPPVASLLVLEHLKNAVSVQVESAKGNLLQPSKVSRFLKPFEDLFEKINTRLSLEKPMLWTTDGTILRAEAGP